MQREICQIYFKFVCCRLYAGLLQVICPISNSLKILCCFNSITAVKIENVQATDGPPD